MRGLSRWLGACSEGLSAAERAD